MTLSQQPLRYKQVHFTAEEKKAFNRISRVVFAHNKIKVVHYRPLWTRSLQLRSYRDFYFF